MLFLCVFPDQLEADRSQKTKYLLYGYMTAFLASIYGHRCGVYQNMTIEEVRSAVCSSDICLINVSGLCLCASL